jgi:hypothetical protein
LVLTIHQSCDRGEGGIRQPTWTFNPPVLGFTPPCGPFMQNRFYKWLVFGRIFIDVDRASMQAVDTAVVYFLKENTYSHRNIYTCTVCSKCELNNRTLNTHRKRKKGGIQHTQPIHNGLSITF